MQKTDYIVMFSQDTQQEIEEALKEIGFKNGELEIALSGRLTDLEEIIDISHFL